MAELASKSGTKSVIWNYFGIEVGADGKPVDDGSALCQSWWNEWLRTPQTCWLTYWRTIPHSITRWRQPWKGRASSQLAKLHLDPPASSQPMLQESMAMRVAYERKGAKWKELTNAVTIFIDKDSLSTYIFGCEKRLQVIQVIPIYTTSGRIYRLWTDLPYYIYNIWTSLPYYNITHCWLRIAE